ncbi:MAG: ATP-dependent zinc metalloprotease FtsH [Eubacterium sp.]|nr:ATP-dependent zinc metalloprotease FtsH [Eubacterium sp.]
MDNSNNQNKNNQGNNNGNSNGNRNGQTLLVFIFAALFVLFIMSFLTNRINRMSSQEVTYTEFLEMVEKDQVESVKFESYQINITPKKEKKEKSDLPENEQLAALMEVNYFTARINDEELLPLLKEHKVEIEGTIPNNTSAVIYNILSFLIPIALIWIILAFAMRRMGGSGGVMGVGKSNAKVYVERKTGVTFADVAGQDEAKESLQEVVDFLHNPKKYTEIGAKLPKGALLVGPPGTGKTLLAKAVAGEANVPFFSLAGSDFVEMFVGVGASRVRDLFKEAQKQAPCIIFIDEIDAIGKSRDSHYGGNDEREQTLNQLLAEMDGFDTSKGLLILAATNRPEILDKALLRPGRFDRRIIVEKPDLKGRVETLKVHSKDVLMDDSVDLDEIALATSGAVGSDLANMINEAAINAVKNGRKYVTQQDLFESVEVVIAGKEKKDRILGKEEKRIVAYHEVGHALTTALQKDAEPVQKITIVPRTMGALGYVMQVPEEEKYLMTQKELLAHIVTFMAGRAAEEIVFDSVTTGASNDIEKATKMARAMVTQYGMSEKFGLMGLESIENRYLDGRAVLNCGDETAAEIDKEVMKILHDAYEEAKKLLLENRDVLDQIAEHLFEHETITGKEFMKIFRRIKGIPEPEEETEETSKTQKNVFEKPTKESSEKPSLKKKETDSEKESKSEADSGKEDAAKTDSKKDGDSGKKDAAKTDSKKDGDSGKSSEKKEKSEEELSEEKRLEKLLNGGR